MLKETICGFILLLSVFFCSCSSTLYVVRHAEKETGLDPATMKAFTNPPLSFEGQQRALKLKEMLGGNNFKHIYSTNTLRTISTANPLKELFLNLVFVRPASTQVDDLLSEITIRVAAGERVLVTTLTKRKSEDLTDFLADNGIKVRYLHSDIDTVERVEIIRDLRLGEFDVLVGINLLREVLDIPEVSLVAILDADKEGFLRSERSLIQTMGRAARHLNGTAILYADKMTESMRRAISETERRRDKQLSFNQTNGITPRGVSKRIKDIIDGIYDAQSAQSELKAAQQQAVYEAMDEKTLAKEIKRLEKLMHECAKNLEFEKAAATRYREFSDLVSKKIRIVSKK